MPVVGVCRGSIVPAVVLEDEMMDTKEALKELEDLTVDYGDRNEEQITRLDEAIDMAINALKAQSDGDTISRQAAIDAILAVTGNSSVRELYEHVQEHGLSDMWSGGVHAAWDPGGADHRKL